MKSRSYLFWRLNRDLIPSVLKRSLALFIVMAVSLLTACGGTTGSREAPVLTQTLASVYRIGESDQIDVSVWKNDELSVDVVVRPDGMITLPLIGDVLASGKTTAELSADITAALSDFVRTPQVTVVVSNPASADFRNRVRVTGAVNAPVSTPFKDGMTVMDLVLTAGGLTDFAAPNKALLYRKNEQGVVTAYAVFLKDILDKGQLKTNYRLQPSDIVTVPERNF